MDQHTVAAAGTRRQRVSARRGLHALPCNGLLRRMAMLRLALLHGWELQPDNADGRARGRWGLLGVVACQTPFRVSPFAVQKHARYAASAWTFHLSAALAPAQPAAPARTAEAS